MTGTGATNPIAPTVTGEANLILPRTKMVIMTDTTTMVDLEIVGVHEDTTADLGIDRDTEDMTMDPLLTDREDGTEGTMTDHGEETTDTRIAGEMTGTGSVTGGKDLAAAGIKGIETGTVLYGYVTN